MANYLNKILRGGVGSTKNIPGGRAGNVDGGRREVSMMIWVPGEQSMSHRGNSFVPVNVGW
jgi:hypothetical protein